MTDTTPTDIEQSSWPKCTNNGCKKRFNPQENTMESCHYHPGKPIFHDTKKGWTCCNKVVYDWDEFQAIPCCTRGKHEETSEKAIGQDAFFKSDTVGNAQRALDKNGEKQIEIKSISKYNEQEEKNKAAQKKQNEGKEKQLYLNANGKMVCINKGCQKEFDPEEKDAICHYHTGAPVFHDLAKYWTCCKKTTYDWDEFMKMPTCAEGKHEPKYV